MSYRKPIPPADAISAHYWQSAAQGKLVLNACNSCKNIMFYPRATCTRCMSDDLAWVEASGRGEVHAFTVCYRAPDAVFRDDAPYVIALIDLPEGPRMMSNVTGCDPDAVHIGMPVEVWFEPATEDIAIPKFKPIGEAL